MRAHHLRAGVPPILVLYADGDDQWRRDQNTQAATALKAAGNPRVEIAQIAGRSHNTIWSRLNEEGDEVGDRIVQFVRKTIGAPSTH